MSISLAGPLAGDDLRDLFTGRSRELDLIMQALREDGKVILSGPFGSGKTTLAKAVAESNAREFPGGIVFSTSFRGASPRALVQQAFAGVVREPALLVLDEADYIIVERIGELERALSGHPLVRVLLVGSSIPNVRGFRRVELGPLSLDEAYSFAMKISQRFGFRLTRENLMRIVEATGGEPRRLAQALQLASATGGSGDLSRLLREFFRPGIVDALGRPVSQAELVHSPIVEEVRSVNARLLERVRMNPEVMKSLDSREFELVVAEILDEKGFDVEVTPASKDGGFDLFAAQRTALGTFLFLVECKRYADHHPVGVQIVRALHGVVRQRNATAGVVATTSHFTRGAIEFQQSIRHQMSLRDYVALQEWLDEKRLVPPAV